MTQPELYRPYTSGEIAALFGVSLAGASLCNGQWLIFPDAVICCVDVGQGPEKSFFKTGACFRWVADRPYHVSSKLPHFLPGQVMGAAREACPILLFARGPDDADFLYLGELEPAHFCKLPTGSHHGTADFALRPALPSALWERLGAAPLGSLDIASVDRALELLRGPTTVEDRLQVLSVLVEFWHSPIRPEDGISDLQLEGLPLPLRWWYRRAGRRIDIMTGQNILFSPADEPHQSWPLTVKAGKLCFYLENQGVYQWSTLPQGDDPPVFGRYERTDPWQKEGMTLSEHLILACLFEAVTCHARYGASAACLEEEKLREITRRIPPVAIAPWRWLNGVRFFAGQGAFMHVAGDARSGRSVFIGAKTEQPLQFSKPYIDGSWEYVGI
jgi:hypothetical protein